MKKVIVHFEEAGELDALVDTEAGSSSFLVPWKWLGDPYERDDDDDDDGSNSCHNMFENCYARVSGNVVNGKIEGTVLLWHYCFNHGICQHTMCDHLLIWKDEGGSSSIKKMTQQNNWVCRMVFRAGKLVQKPTSHRIVMKKYRCRSIWRVFFSTIPMSRNSLKCCAQWWGGDEGYVPIIVEWS